MVDFKILEGNLGVSISGGSDSALVLYLLMKNYSGPLKVFNTSWDEKPNHFEAVNNVYQKCIELTKNKNSLLLETKVNTRQDENNIFTTPLEYLRRGIVQYVYTGLSANPPIELKHAENKIEKREIRRDKLIDDNNFYLPFANENKKTIASLYEHHNLMESLFPLTFSCVVSDTLEHCGDCWWCEERKWGFGKL